MPSSSAISCSRKRAATPGSLSAARRPIRCCPERASASSRRRRRCWRACGPRIDSAALRTAPGAHHWVIRYLEFAANQNGFGDILQLGDGSSAQNSLDKVPHHIVLSHLYVHGDPVFGQKRCIALNAANTMVSDSHVAECKAVGQDSQAIGGWNGPGPYIIENNYVEAAAENFLLGGADPAITNLVADGVTFRRNHLSRPMAWRNPIISTPSKRGRRHRSGWIVASWRVCLSRHRPPTGRAGLDGAVVGLC